MEQDMKQAIRIINWDSLVGWEMEIPKNGTALTLPITVTDEELIAYLRALNDDPTEENGEWTWSWDSIARGENTAIIEWRNDSNHLVVTTVIWIG